MRRSIQWMLSLLAVAGLTSATAAQAQPMHQPNTSDKHLATNLGQLNLDSTAVIDGKTMP
jgi:hypothetical protein